MSGPAAHVVYAQKMYSRLPSINDEQAFVVGTLFPDIRALRVVDRTATHPANATYQELSHEADSFRAGFLLHALIDKAREAFAVQHNCYENLPNSYLTTVAVKICEDEDLYDLAMDWPSTLAYLDEVLPEETAFGIVEEKIALWHTLHQEFLRRPPRAGVAAFLRGIGFSDMEIRDTLDIIPQVRNRRWAHVFYDNLEVLLRDS